MLQRQLGFFGNEAPDIDREFRTLTRIELSPGAWLEHAPGWLRGDAQLFEHLLATTRFRGETRTMYEREVEVPRVYAAIPADGPGHPVIPQIAAVLESRYGERFERVSVALYRDGRDSVAFHGDYVARKLPNALVASVSLGGPRRFLVRPTGGGRSLGLSLGPGDLLVMGGSTQRTHQHAIPKVARAEPRIAVLFRPSWVDPDAGSS